MSKSQTRQDCEAAEADFAAIINLNNVTLLNPTMLMVGTAGNPRTHKGKPGLDNPRLFSRYTLTTLDFDKKWEPDIVGNIVEPTDWSNGITYDLIHITQVIEHIPHITELSEAFDALLNRGGYVIVDSPWGPKAPDYHGEAGSFGDYWRLSKDAFTYLFGFDFEIVKIISTDANTSCLLRKK
ncbi:MAG TPA: hypothetical protein PKX31_00125 [Chitinophagaceae bacterium]|nr:hypothetical protein [Chitinophagaceae bacterium]